MMDTQPPEAPTPGEQRPREYAWDTQDPDAWVAVRDKNTQTDTWIKRAVFDARIHQPIASDTPSLGPPPVGTIAHPVYKDPTKPGSPCSRPSRSRTSRCSRSRRDQTPSNQPAPQAAADSAASGAAAATAQSGGSTEQIADAAASAAVKALDQQTLGQQTPWTQQAFRSRYGASAESQWAQEHNAELERNQRLYGSREPAPGTPAVLGSGAPMAPDRTIGAVKPPAPDTMSRYGFNGPPIAPAPIVQKAAPAAPAGAPSSVLPGNLPRYPGLIPSEQNVGAGTGEPPARAALPPEPIPQNAGSRSRRASRPRYYSGCIRWHRSSASPPPDAQSLTPQIPRRVSAGDAARRAVPDPANTGADHSDPRACRTSSR
jgi:hypothetical protein